MTLPGLSILVAMATNRVIGKENQLPWHLPADLKHFKTLTMGHTIVMGRKTYQSIGKPLSGRYNVIITHQKDFIAPGATVVHSVEDALNLCQQTGASTGESFIIGGERLYQQTLKFCSRLYITEIQKDFEGDTFFPELNPDEWEEKQRKINYASDDQNFEYHFVVFDRKA